MNDKELRELANRDWVPGFDGAVLPGRIGAMRMADDMRRILKVAATVLGQDRAQLTYAVREMRKTPADQRREKAIHDALDAGLGWLESQRAMIIEAKERMKVADARLQLIDIDCGKDGGRCT